MSLPPEKVADLRLKHLEMIQAIISRIANNGAAIKNYCITITTAVCGFALTLQRPAIGALALLPILAFALLDAQYLRLERRFRCLFDNARKEEWSAPPTFAIDLTTAPAISLWSAIKAWPIIGFYGTIAGSLALFMFVAKAVYGRF